MLGRAGRTSQTCVISHSGLCRVCHLLHQLNALKMLLTRGKAICGLPTRAGEGWLSQMGCWWHSRGWRVLSWVRPHILGGSGASLAGGSTAKPSWCSWQPGEGAQSGLPARTVPGSC